MRNRFYDWGILKSTSPKVKTIVIGNLALGGTGKSPHTEYLINLLSSEYKIAILSRGYGRKTKGFVLAKMNSTTEEIGDEPTQFKQKFKNIPIAVCENRVAGINKLTELHPDLQCVILDDAFQHRKLKSKMNILLSAHYKIYKDNFVIPTGTLRDHKNEANRANIVVISKCPVDLNNTEQKLISDKLSLKKNQELYFSTIKYGDPTDQFGRTNLDLHKVILVSGIANPKLFEEYCSNKYKVIQSLAFKDHYRFLASDLDAIASILAKFAADELAIITTEKDFVKLKPLNDMRTNPIPLYYLPIEIAWLNDSLEFDNKILKYLSNE